MNYLLIAFGAFSIASYAAEVPGRFLFTGRIPGHPPQIFLAVEDGGSEKQVTNFKKGATYPKWSPGSPNFACLSDHKVLILTDGGELEGEIGVDGEEVQFFDWSPDGGKIAYISRHFRPYSSKLIIRTIATSDERVLFSGDFITDVHWSPDGKNIAFVLETDDGEPQVVVVAEAAGKELARTHQATPTSEWTRDRAGNIFPPVLTSICWSPDSNAVAYAVSDIHDHLRLLDLMSKAGSALGVAGDSGVAWMKNGTDLLFSNRDAPGLFIQRSGRVGREQITPEGFYASRPLALSDPERVAFLTTWPARVPGNGLSICISNSDGSKVRRVTSHQVDEQFEGFSWAKAR